MRRGRTPRGRNGRTSAFINRLRELVAPDVQRFADVALGESDCAEQTVVYVHEPACLFTVAPYFDVPAARAQRFDDLSAQGRRRFFTAALSNVP